MNKPLNELTDAELQAELERRKAPYVPMPAPKANPDFTALIKMMEGVKRDAMLDGYENDDFKHYIYEMAIEAVYGKEYWIWRKAQKW